MILQRIYRDIPCVDAVQRATDEATKLGYKVTWLYAAPQATLFDGKDDAYVELHMEK